MIMMFKLVVFLVMMFGGTNAKQDDVKNDRQLSVHLANIVEQMTRLMDEFQVRMERLEEKMEELPARIGRLEEKMDVGMNRSNNMMEEKMEKLEEKVEEIPRKMDKLEYDMVCHNWVASRLQKNGFYLDQLTGKIMTYDCKETLNMSSDWTVIQRRVSANVDFFRGWNDYKNGFGNPQGSFWLGLENIHTICSRNCQLNITMSKAQNQDLTYAHYHSFSISDEKDKYRLHVNGYHGNARDGLLYNNGAQFSTKDYDNDNWDSGNCAQHFTGAFWYNYNSCSDVNPNGQYFIGSPPHPGFKGIIWSPYTSWFQSLKFIEMKVKPTS